MRCNENEHVNTFSAMHEAFGVVKSERARVSLLLKGATAWIIEATEALLARARYLADFYFIVLTPLLANALAKRSQPGRA